VYEIDPLLRRQAELLGQQLGHLPGWPSLTRLYLAYGLASSANPPGQFFLGESKGLAPLPEPNAKRCFVHGLLQSVGGGYVPVVHSRPPGEGHGGDM
jgi:hypothetical protein